MGNPSHHSRRNATCGAVSEKGSVGAPSVSTSSEVLLNGTWCLSSLSLHILTPQQNGAAQKTKDNKTPDAARSRLGNGQPVQTNAMARWLNEAPKDEPWNTSGRLLATGASNLSNSKRDKAGGK